MRTALVTIFILLFFAGSSEGATIRVARDGSGDYTVIADAVLSASSGDTISIGPGEYPEVRTFDTPGGPQEYVAEVELSELTFIGDHRDSVILGPEVPPADFQAGASGIVTSIYGNVRVRGVTIRNSRAGVWGNGQWLEVEDSRFVGCGMGVDASISGFVTVRRSEFVGSEKRGVVVFAALGANGALVEGCRFFDNQMGIDFQPQNCIVRDCVFDGGGNGSSRNEVGMQVSFGGSALIERCEFDRMDGGGGGLAVVGGSRVTLRDSTFGSDMSVNVLFSGRLSGTGNVLSGGRYATVILYTYSEVDFTGNHLLNAGGWTVRVEDVSDPPVVRVKNFENNYWGTRDTAQIDEWIFDRPDNPVYNHSVVDYLPLAEQPISVEATTFGELKARFGP